MALEDDLNVALEKRDRDAATAIMNALRSDALRAVRSRDWHELQQVEQDVSDALVRYRGIIRGQNIDQSFVAGQMYAIQGIVRGFREGHASPEDIHQVKRSKAHLAFVLALWNHGALLASDIKEHLGITNDSRLCQIGDKLTQAGLVRKDRVGRHASYRLTASGSLVAQDLSEELTRNSITRTPSILPTNQAGTLQPLGCAAAGTRDPSVVAEYADALMRLFEPSSDQIAHGLVESRKFELPEEDSNQQTQQKDLLDSDVMRRYPEYARSTKGERDQRTHH